MIRNSLYMYLVLWLLNMKCIFDAPKYFFYTFGNKDLKIWTLNSKRHCFWISPPSWSEYKLEKNQCLVKIQRTDQPFYLVPEPDIFPPLCSIIHFFSKSAACWPNPKCWDTALTRYLPLFPTPGYGWGVPDYGQPWLSAQVQSRDLATLFTGKDLQGKATIGAVGVVTVKLVSGNRHHSYSLNSAAFGIIVILSLAEGSALPYKSLHTSSDPARRLIGIYGCPNAHLWSICAFFEVFSSWEERAGSKGGVAECRGFIRLVSTADNLSCLWRRCSNSFIPLTLKIPLDGISGYTRQFIRAVNRWKVHRPINLDHNMWRGTMKRWEEEVATNQNYAILSRTFSSRRRKCPFEKEP